MGRTGGSRLRRHAAPAPAAPAPAPAAPAAPAAAPTAGHAGAAPALVPAATCRMDGVPAGVDVGVLGGQVKNLIVTAADRCTWQLLAHPPALFDTPAPLHPTPQFPPPSLPPVAVMVSPNMARFLTFRPGTLYAYDVVALTDDLLHKLRCLLHPDLAALVEAGALQQGSVINVRTPTPPTAEAPLHACRIAPPHAHTPHAHTFCGRHVCRWSTSSALRPRCQTRVPVGGQSLP